MFRKPKEREPQAVNSPAKSIFQTSKAKGTYNKPLIHALAIIIVAIVIYSNTFNASFQFDDSVNIVENPTIKDLHYFSDPSTVDRITIPNELRKLLKTRYIGYLTFALNYRMHGFDVMGYHLVNILIHTFNSLFLYWFMTLTFRTPFFSSAGGHLASHDGVRSFIAVFTALLFAVHPIQTQAVTYIVQRFTSLATLFYLLSLVMYIKFRRQQSAFSGQPGRHATLFTLYAVSLISAVLAMKTKEFAFTLPVVMTMYELMFFDGKIMKRLLYLIPFFLIIILIPMSLTGTGGFFTDISGINEEAVNMSGASASISRGDYLLTQIRVIVTYIRLLFFPVNQNIDYDYPIYRSFFMPAVFLSFLFLLMVIIAGIYLYHLSKRSETEDRFWLRLISFGIFWFFIALSAESGVIPINDVIFEHRVYLPSVGFFIVFVVASVAGIERWGRIAAYAKKALLYVFISMMLALSGATYARNDLWKDGIRLWEKTVKGSPNKARLHNNLGVAYAAQGRIDEAINEYKTAIKLKPDYADAYNNLGVAYTAQGRIDEAINEYRVALMHNPAFAMAHNNLGAAYGTKGQNDEAIKEFKAALKFNPGNVMARQSLDFLLKK